MLVVFDPAVISYDGLLTIFWETHDPTQGMRQGNDAGTQYRSGIYAFNDAQRTAAQDSQQQFQSQLVAAGFWQDTAGDNPLHNKTRGHQ